MWCITIEDGKDVRQMFYKEKNKDEAFEQGKKILEEKINIFLKIYGEDELMFNYNYIPLTNLQSILTVMIKLHCELENYDDNRFEVHINKFEFENVDDN